MTSEHVIDSGTTALLVLVHGSPRPDANGDMFRVVDQIRRRARFALVEVGFLECNEPRITDAIDTCVRRGAKEIVAVPYFLHTGTHVAGDLPSLLLAARKKYPTVRFRLGTYLGRSPVLTDILRDRIESLREP